MDSSIINNNFNNNIIGGLNDFIYAINILGVNWYRSNYWINYDDKGEIRTMNKELALRTFAYLIGHYKTHNATIINKQEIEAIEFILKDNEFLKQQCKKQKGAIDKAIELLGNYKHYSTPDEKQNSENEDLVNNAFDILKEVE